MRFWLPAGYGFDTAGLKFLFDPARILNTDGALSLGDNLITNGDFHDFTMEDDANVKGHWIFDSYYDGLEGGNGIENDWSDNDNDLTPTNFETDFEGSLIGSNPAYENGNALKFNGIDQNLSILSASAGDFNPSTGDFSIEIWFKTSPTATDQNLYFKDLTNPAAGNIRLYITSAGAVRFRLMDGTHTGNLIGSNYADDAWHYVAIVVDRDVGAYMYIDGVVHRSEETAEWTDFSASDLHTGDVIIGSVAEALYFDGEIAEVRYSNVARSYAEIQQSYGMGKGWSPFGSDATTVWENNSFVQAVKRVGASDTQTQVLTLESGELYRIEVTAWTEAGGNNAFVIFDYGTGSFNPGLFDPGDTAQKFVWYLRSDGTAGGIRVGSGNTTKWNYYDNVKVQKVQNSMDTLFSVESFVEDFSLGGVRNEQQTIFDFTHAVAAFNELAQSGGSITTMIKSQSDTAAFASSADLGVLTTGQWLKVSYNLTVNSGTAPYIRISDTQASVSTDSEAFQTIAGSQEHYIQMTNDCATSFLTVSLGAAQECDVVITNLQLVVLANGFHGVTANSLEDNQPTHPSGIEFDGVADYVNFGDVLDFGTSDVLISTWIKVPDGTPVAADYILGKFEDGSNYWFIRFEIDGDLNINSVDGGVTSISAITTNTGLIPDNEWVHIAMVLDRDGNVHVYVNNVAKTVTTNTMNANAQDSVGDFRLGEVNTKFMEGFIGFTTIYIFDGADGAPAALPADYATLISNIYDWSLANRFGYGTDK